MKLIIAGSRSIDREIAYAECVKWRIANRDKEVLEIVSGTAKGVDRGGEDYAEFYDIPVKRFPAKWTDFSDPETVIKINKYGQKYNAKAGFIRNKAMAHYADALLLIWDGRSGGSANMKENMEKLGKPIYEVIL